jgi:hypothetical protein
MNTNKFILKTTDDDTKKVLYVARKLTDNLDRMYWLSPYLKDAYEFDPVYNPDTVRYTIEKHCHFVNLEVEYIT